MFELVGLSKSYDQGRVRAVDDLDLSISDGEIVGFLGPNGAGKTTTIEMMVGLLAPDQGRVLLDGIDVWEEPLKAKKRLGFLPENPQLYERLTGIEYVNFLADVFEVRMPQRRQRVAHLLDLFEMTDNIGDPINSYSHGMRQKTALIGALVHDPPALIMDEPMSGLDPKSSFRFKELLRQRCERGQLVFLSTHVLEVAERICDRVAIIDDGQLVAEGTMEQLRQRAGSSKSLERFFLDITEGD